MKISAKLANSWTKCFASSIKSTGTRESSIPFKSAQAITEFFSPLAKSHPCNALDLTKLFRRLFFKRWQKRYHGTINPWNRLKAKAGNFKLEVSTSTQLTKDTQTTIRLGSITAGSSQGELFLKHKDHTFHVAKMRQ